MPGTGEKSVPSGHSSGRLPSGRTGGRSRTTAAQGRLGAGLFEVPPALARDPGSAVLRDPQVPPSRQRCRVCGELVGQARDGMPAFAEGYCPHDGTRFSFTPKLNTGDRVEDRYEILGCLAYGGLGWIYLARDRRLGDHVAERWVVLKGLIDTDDPDAVAAAVNERRFLVEVDHPNIVKIHDFVQHPDPRTGSQVGYLVMEYLGGQSLQERYLGHRDAEGNRAPLPLPVVLAYGLEILQAFGYLHEKGLVYCDLKPDNVLQVGQQVKLIDLGAVLRLADRPRAIYGAVGFQAPELERTENPMDPSVASDLYTVGRTLALISFPFPGFTTEYRHRLPEPADVPLLAEEESYYRLLRRATHPDPDRRFASAGEMRDQVHGVLLEVLSAGDGEPRPAPSAYFTPERGTFGTAAGEVSADGGADQEVDWAAVPQALPTPLVDPSDPGAGFLATLGATEPADLVATLLAAPVRSAEVLLRLVDARIAAGDHDGARADLAEFAAAAPRDWRVAWYQGVAALAAGDRPAADTAFDAVYGELPGELAPKLALAAAAEWGGDDERAGALYGRVWRTDTTYVNAAFGLARVLRRRRRWPDAVAALDGVPDTSSQHLAAQVAAIRTRLDPDQVGKADLLDASARLQRLKMDIERQARLSVEVFTAALNWVLDHPGAERSGTVVGHAFDERKLRTGLERAYRHLAKLADDPDTRSGLVDRANQVRPWTLV
ncbi:serine/threonine-protein kinase [Amycolatopsis samaneae]|uniref:non-specific serine/threonine protein kinase n=1 Tax=Amycolatopsis samaneae TaxID=664691 RepID=A0ABW5GT98_9PSEU